MQNIKISVTRKKLSITNTDILFILDYSGSMDDGEIQSVKKACSDILDAMMGEGLSSNFYIGVIGFGTSAKFIGEMNNASMLNELKNKINTNYGGRR